MVREIITNTNSLIFINETGARETITKSHIKKTLVLNSGVVRLFFNNEVKSMDIYVGSSIDGVVYDDVVDLQDKISSFKSGGSGPGTEASWDSLDGKPAFIAAGATAAAARNAIGLGSAATRPAGDFEPAGAALTAETNAKTYADGLLAGIYRLKPPVETEEDLPSTDNEVGDVRIVLADGNDWVWIGEEEGWYDLGNKVRVHFDDLEGKPTSYTPSAHTHTSDDISDASTVGKNILTASTQADARTALGLGSAAQQATSAFATSAQGALAASAVQPAALAAKANNVLTIVSESGASLTYGLTHVGTDKIVRTTGGGNKTHTVPPQDSVPWPDGSVINGAAASSDVTIVAGAGVNIIAPIPSPWVVEANTLYTLSRLGSNEWVLAARFKES